MNPIGLTRAEEEKEAPVAPPASQPPAPDGTRRCVATVPPDGAACGAAARWLAVWVDPEAPKSPVCTECGKRLRATAQAHGTSVGFEPLERTE